MGMLNGKVAFITGAASGIGAGTARRFAQEGARVALADVQAAEGEQVQQEIVAAGGEALLLTCDVSDPASVQQAIAATVAQFGRLDIVFANAGINGVWTPIEELQPEEWDRTIDINLKGTYLTVHFAVPHLKQANGGSIIITSSVSRWRRVAAALIRPSNERARLLCQPRTSPRVKIRDFTGLCDTSGPGRLTSNRALPYKMHRGDAEYAEQHTYLSASAASAVI